MNTLHFRHDVRLPFAAATILLTCTAAARAADKWYTGDVGTGAAYVQPHMRGEKSEVHPIPFVNGDAGLFFGRIDAFGVKTSPLGYGALEVVGQYRADGFTAPGEQRRTSSVPIGLGTLQITPIGAFELRSLHDFGKSHGNLLQARYLAELPLGRLNLYPELGLEYEDSRYTRYYFGTPGAGGTQEFRPHGALNPYFGMFAELHIAGSWYANAYYRRSFLDDEVSASPLVTRKAWNSALLAVSYRF
jgi:outer membrane scaffolding protein for murein synthesis (MipA/OmpV family)